MAFDDVSAEAYERFMGRFSTLLSPLFADVALAGVAPFARVLDVGCGPGVLTAELARRVGERGVAAADPAAAFVAATAARFPAADVRTATAESLPWPDSHVDAACAQLVVQFMADPVAGAREMARVTRPGGRVAVCVWDHGGGTGPLSPFWRTATRLHPAAPAEGRGTGSNEGDLRGLLTEVGLRDVVETRLSVRRTFETFDDWWEPYTGGVGPVGDYLHSLPGDRLAALVDALRADLGEGPFSIDASAWTAFGTVPDDLDRQPG